MNAGTDGRTDGWMNKNGIVRRMEGRASNFVAGWMKKEVNR